jgi:uncharacterized membrane protein YcaP (DUF421 family)
MGSVVRGVIVYLLLLLIFRIAGKRTLSNVTTFDFVLLLIISETIQQALVGADGSMINAMLLVLTLVSLNIVFSSLKHRWPKLDRAMEGIPVLILSYGKPHREIMARERIGEEDIMHAARAAHGLSSLDQVEFAILETSGGISVIPRKGNE